MKIFKPFFLTLVLVVGFGCFCDCPEITGDYYNILGFDSLIHTQLKNDEFSYLTDNDTIDFTDYKGLEFSFNSEFTFGKNETPATPFDFSLTNTAYGTSCNCIYNGDRGSLQKVEAFDIITINDFDSLHLANDTITEYFITEYDMPLDSFLIQNQNRLFGSWRQVGDEEDKLKFRLLLLEQPKIDDLFQVKVNIELDNGVVYSMESDAIIIE
jgi:hypothetical protein